jgi:serine/threonine protein kinase
MALTIGTQLGSHEITALLGKGGMGEVYRARDLKLKREVAVKILPDEFVRDADRVSRFQREAEVLASLNHPNIAAIHSLEEASGARFLVLELVEGETLSDRLRRGPLPVDEALNIAGQICNALEAAHEKGIVHRDLKPANVKVTPEGKVKVLDFGLAKAIDGVPSQAALSNSPTINSLAATNVGVIIGTAAYMSPEQARGFVADARSDVFSFGCVLYEMLAGRQAFEGDTVSDILAGILAREPNFSFLPVNLNPKIFELLRRSLEKNPKRRWYAVGDLRFEIEAALAEPSVSTRPNLNIPTRRVWPAWAIAIAAVIAAGALLVRDLDRPAAPEVRLEVVTPRTADPTSIAVSPDGKKMVFVGSDRGRSQLFVRFLDSVDVKALAGTENASFPFWSPNSRSVGFFAESKLKRIDVLGGSVQVLAFAAIGLGGTWNRNDVILFCPNAASGISRVPAGGGPVVQVTNLDMPRAQGHRAPYFLPDGRHFLFWVQSDLATRGVYWGDLESGDHARLFDSDSNAVYSSSGHLLFIRQGTLFAQSFDADKRVLTGDPFSVAQPVSDNSFNIGAISAGADVLVYRTGLLDNRQLIWVDRSGRAIGDVGPTDATALLNPELSPDGRRVALDRTVDGNHDVWILEPERHITTRFSDDPSVDFAPVWSPTGDRILFASAQKGQVDLYVKPSAGAATEQALLQTLEAKIPLDWSRDGRFIIYRTINGKTGNDLWILPLSDLKPYVFLATQYNEANAQFSPDTRWVAYQSDESGQQHQIYVQPFPGPGGKIQVSNEGGTQPRWNRNGKELFYLAADNKLMSVSIETTPDGKTLRPAVPVPLFSTHIVEVPPATQRHQYAVSPDGQRFLINVPAESAAVSPITVVVNWHPGLRK